MEHLAGAEPLCHVGLSVAAETLVFTVRRYASTVHAVCPSQAGTVPKRLNVGSRKQHRPGILVF